LGILINLRATCDLRFSQLGGVESFLEQELDLPLGGSPSHPTSIETINIATMHCT